MVATPASIPRPNQPLPAQTPNLKVRLEYYDAALNMVAGWAYDFKDQPGD